LQIKNKPFDLERNMSLFLRMVLLQTATFLAIFYKSC
jgi:hypothetical protein